MVVVGGGTVVVVRVVVESVVVVGLVLVDVDVVDDVVVVVALVMDEALVGDEVGVVLVLGVIEFEAEVTIAVASEVATADPFLFVTTTATRNLRPTSADVGRYVRLAADAIGVHAEPDVSQPSH